MRQMWPPVVWLVTLAAPASALEIADQRQARAEIRTLRPGAHAEVVGDLQRILKQVTLAERFPVAAGPPKAGSIFVGTRDEAVAGGVKDLPDLAKEEVLLTLHGDCLYLLGGGLAGVSHAVYTWLDRLGCRWFMPGEIGECLVRRPTLIVRPFTHRHAPSFSMRCLWYAWGANTPACGKRFAEWARRNCQGGNRVHASHNFRNLVSPDKYFASHPEYFSLIDGKRQAKQLCTSNPEVIRIAAETIIALFDKRPDGPYTMSLSPNDNDDFCECPTCRALDVGKPDPFNLEKPWVTDRLMVFWNAVAARVARKYPQALLGVYAYMNHTAAPQREKVHPNLAPTLTAQPFCTIHSIADPWCASRQQMRITLDRWCALSQHVYIYDYDPPVGHRELPSPLYTAHATEIPLYHRMGVKGFSWECHDAWAITSPNLWISARLQWDAARDPNALMDSYLRDFFGPAVEPMRRYYDALAACYRQRDVHPGWRIKGLPKLYRPDLVKRMRSAMNDALRSAGRGVLRRRVQMVELALRYLEAYQGLAAAEKATDHDGILSAAKRVGGVLDEFDRLNEDYMLKTQPRKWLRQCVAEARHYLPNGRAFRRKHDVWVQLGLTWRVRFEEESGPPPVDWARPGFDDTAWHELSGDEQWYRQIRRHVTGRGWARCTFKAPDACRGRRLLFHVGALDERGTLYLNGERVHVRTGEGDLAWCTPFTFEVTGKIRPGQVNTLAVQVVAASTLGGVWKPVWLYSPKDR